MSTQSDLKVLWEEIEKLKQEIETLKQKFESHKNLSKRKYYPYDPLPQEYGWIK